MIMALLGILALVLGMTVIAFQARRGRFFTLLTFYSAFFVLEFAGGALKFSFPEVFPDYAGIHTDPSLADVPQALAISIGGFLLFLYGYLCVAPLMRGGEARKLARSDYWFDRWWTPGYKFLLLLVTIFVIVCGFIQHGARIRSAGGLSSFIATAYMHRAGTATTTGGETAVVVLANLLGAPAIALTLIWMFAWLHGRLNLFEKFIVLNLFLLLFLRQASTMFRSILILTLLSLFAGYVSERRISYRQWVMIGGAIFGVLVAANFFHLYMYYLTAGWDRQGLIASMAQLLAPQGHLYTLSYVVSTANNGAPLLAGTGFVESFFFFIPRGIWETKLDSASYGTFLVQNWAGLPIHYQMAITNVGELIAHFGKTGMVGMVVYGAVYAVWDSFADRGPVMRAALYGILLGRVLADAGMGLSALAITCTVLTIHFGAVGFVCSGVSVYAMVSGVPRLILRAAQPGNRRSPVGPRLERRA